MPGYFVKIFLCLAAVINISCAKLEDHQLEPPKSEMYDSRDLTEENFLMSFDREGWEVPMDDGSLISDIIVNRILESPKPVYIHLYSHGWQYDYIEAKKEFLKFISLTEKDKELLDSEDFYFIAIYLHWPSASKYASSFLYMQDRAKLVGSTGGYDFLLKLQKAFEKNPYSKLVLLGHSLGAQVVCEMITGPLSQKSLVKPVDGLVFIEGAISMWSLCSRIPDPERDLPMRKDIGPGLYWEIIRDGKVNGPIINIFSRNDTVLREWFELGTQNRGGIPLEYRPEDYKVGHNAKTTLPAFGAIGGHGASGPMPRVTKINMKKYGEYYSFKPGWVYNVDASEFIKDHMKFQKPETMWTIYGVMLSNLFPKGL